MRPNKPYRSPWADEKTEAFRDVVCRFLDKDVVPTDEEARHNGYVDKELWRKAGKLGFLCSEIPVEYGGYGGNFRNEAVFIEEMARRGLTGMNSGINSIAAHYILKYGTEAQKIKYLPRMASGEIIGSIAMIEPVTGSGAQEVRTRAVREGDFYIVNGAKTFVSNGYLADIILVVCKTDPRQKKSGTSILIVETVDQDGLVVGRLLDKIGEKAQDTAELFFEDMPIPVGQLLGGGEERGFFQLMRDLPYERLMVAVTAVGAMEGALAATLNYVKDCADSGTSVYDDRSTKFKLAEVAAQARAARVFLDACIVCLLKGELDSVTASMVKLVTTDAQGKIIDECLQLFGGYGCMNENLIGRMFLDSRIQRIYGGTNEFMKEIISRSL